MKPSTLRSMLVALSFCLPTAVFAQSVETPKADLVEVQAPETEVVSAPSDNLTTEKEPKRFRSWMRSTGMYQRWYVRITLHSTPDRKAR